MSQDEIEAPAARQETHETLHDVLDARTVLFLCAGLWLLHAILTGIPSLGTAPLGGLLLGAVVGILAPILAVLRHLDLRWRWELGLVRLRLTDGLASLAATAAAIPAIYALGQWCQERLPPDLDHLGLYSSLIPDGPVDFAAGVGVVVVVAPLAEEVLFRGLFLPLCARRMPVGLAIAVTSIAFGASHGALWMLPPLGLFGALLGFLAWRTRSLFACWIAHAAFNLVGYLELAVTRDAGASAIARWAVEPARWGMGCVLLGAILVWLWRRPRPPAGLWPVWSRRAKKAVEEPRPTDVLG